MVKRILVFLFLVFAVLMVLRFFVGGSEDTWICVDGEWEKHGVPSAPKPQTPCPK